LLRLEVVGSTRILPESVILRLDLLETLHCSSTMQPLENVGMGMVFPPEKFCSDLLSVRNFFSAKDIEIDFKKSGLRVQDVANLGAALENVVVQSIDLSDNEALGTLGVAMVLEWVGPGVKSVNMKGTGLEPGYDLLTSVGVGSSEGGIASSAKNAAAAVVSVVSMTYFSSDKRLTCDEAHWKKLESALRKLAKLEAIDLSDNGALGTLGVAMVLEWVGPGVKSVNMKGTGLGLAAGQSLQQGPSRTPCSAEDWPKLEDALRKLAKLEAIDLSDNGALGTSGVGRLVSCCAGESLSFMARLVRLLLFL
jgi:hypothetical protein